MAVAKKNKPIFKLNTIIQMQNNNQIKDQSGNSHNHVLCDASLCEDISVLLDLKKMYQKLTDINEKRTIKRLIDKRPNPFVITKGLCFDEKELSGIRNYLSRAYNNKIAELFPYKDDEDSDTFFRRQDKLLYYYVKNHWFPKSKEYLDLVHIRAEFNLKKEAIFKKAGMELLSIYTEEQIELIIKKHYNL